MALETLRPLSDSFPANLSVLSLAQIISSAWIALQAVFAEISLQDKSKVTSGGLHKSTGYPMPTHPLPPFQSRPWALASIWVQTRP